MRHVISALVMNEPGVLAGVANMFSARGFNIDSLVVGRTDDPSLSRMTIVVDADDNTVDQVRKQLAKLVPVVSVVDFQGMQYVERDLALLTIGVSDRAPQRGDRDRQPLPRQGGGRRPGEPDGRAGRDRAEDRGLHRPDEALRHPAGRPHRRDRHGPRHPRPANGRRRRGRPPPPPTTSPAAAASAASTPRRRRRCRRRRCPCRGASVMGWRACRPCPTGRDWGTDEHPRSGRRIRRSPLARDDMHPAEVAVAAGPIRRVATLGFGLRAASAPCSNAAVRPAYRMRSCRALDEPAQNLRFVALLSSACRR